MTPFQFAVPSTSMGSRIPLRAAALGLCALALGCEPETGTDAGRNDAAHAEAGASDASIDVPLRDATVPIDTATPPGGDAAAPSDAAPPIPLDASMPDANGLDSASSDGATLDSTVSDSAAADSAVSDSSSSLDAAVDAGAADAGNLGEASTGDAAQAVRTQSGEVRWPLSEGPGTASCSQRSIALWRQETFTLDAPNAQGFVCGIASCVRHPDFPSNATFNFHDGDIQLSITFRDRILDGYSVESFRENWLQTNLQPWTTSTKTNIGSRVVQLRSDWEPMLEFVSYQAPVLHVRLHTVATHMASSFNEPAAVPYVCFRQTPAGPVPDLCTDVSCEYWTDDSEENGVSLTLDLKVPIEQPR